METKLITVSGVTGYEKDGVAYLRLEDVARGLGFTKSETKSGTDYESVRWERVFGYLSEFGFDHKWAKDGYIPENIFYRLAFKAKNEVAERFQSKVADEILPAIRKTGSYSIRPRDSYMISDPVERATAWIEEEKRRQELAAKVEEDKPKVLFADSVSVSPTAILIGELAKILKQNGIVTGPNRLFQWLRENGYLISRHGTDYNTPTQRAMELGLFSIKETTITHSDGRVAISKTTKVTGKGQQYFVNKFLDETRRRA